MKLSIEHKVQYSADMTACEGVLLTHQESIAQHEDVLCIKYMLLS